MGTRVAFNLPYTQSQRRTTNQPSTFNLQPSTFNLQPSTFNLQPSTLAFRPPYGNNLSVE
ncbi:MAG: hypothetical protein F6K64_13220 [Moorea sp. SIO3A2]|nr:hypothetical protein [Moorena sp. SIO3A2]